MEKSTTSQTASQLQAPGHRTGRGVQQSDVWAAADSLLRQGQRPTIERVRQHLGRGSPNTVSPMLEAWFAVLGKRLHAAPGTHPDARVEPTSSLLPAPLQRLAQDWWHSALEQATTRARADLQQREQSLQEAQEALAHQRADLVRREAAVQAQKQAMEQALELAQQQAQTLAQQIHDLHQQLQSRDARLEEARQALLEAAQQQKALQETVTAERQAAAAERQRLGEQYAGNERHMLAEIDRVRQELAAARKQAQHGENRAQAQCQQLQQQLERSAQENKTLHAHWQEARHAAGQARAHSTQLQGQLLAQQRLLRQAVGNRPPSAAITRTSVPRRSLRRGHAQKQGATQ